MTPFEPNVTLSSFRNRDNGANNEEQNLIRTINNVVNYEDKPCMHLIANANVVV